MSSARTDGVIVPPLVGNCVLPSLLTLYRRDRAELTPDNLDTRLYHCLDIPPRVAISLCIKHPQLWTYVMDFIQECNLAIFLSHTECDPAWDIARFRRYVVVRSKGSVLQYLSRTRPIAIPHESRRLMLLAHQEHKVKMLEQHVSWDMLLRHTAIVPDMSNVQRGWNDATRKRVASILDQLPSREREALSLWFGIDGHAHTPQEIAPLLGVTSSNAIVMVNRAIKRIRHEHCRPSREEINNEREARLETVYACNPDIGVAEMVRQAKCAHSYVTAFLKRKRHG